MRLPVISKNLLRLQTFHSIRASSSRRMASNNQEAILTQKYVSRETRFKTPYGHIAGLEWGDSKAPNKILCIHGWLDNAGSFARLIPFVLDHGENSEKYHIVALDMPGTGFSSHKPPGADYNMFSYIIEMRRVAMQLGWDKLTLIGHSLGAFLSFTYSCVYPQQVEGLVSLDIPHPFGRSLTNWNLTIANSIDDHFKCEQNQVEDPNTSPQVPIYTKEDAMKRLMNAHSLSLTEESAEVMFKRGARRQSWGYTFNRDIRLRYMTIEYRPDEETMFKMYDGPFRANLLVIRTLRSIYHRPEDWRLRYYAMFEKNCPLFRDVTIDGTHHFHMNKPELVAPDICKFLDDVKQQRGQGEVDKSRL